MSDQIDPIRAVGFIIAKADEYAQAKANRIYIEHFIKSKKALLMAESGEKAVNAREQYAYGHDEYIALLEGLKQAVEAEEELKWKLTAAQLKVEIWRSQEASNRNQERTLR